MDITKTIGPNKIINTENLGLLLSTKMLIFTSKTHPQRAKIIIKCIKQSLIRNIIKPE